MTVLGNGDYQYRELDNWAELPDGWRFKEVADVAVDGEDQVYVFNRSEHPMMVFDREGHFLTSWGEDLFTHPHGLTLGPDGMLYCVDDDSHCVRRCTTEGKLLSTFGMPGLSPHTIFNSSPPSCRSPNGLGIEYQWKCL